MLQTRDVRDTDQLRQLAIVAHELRNPLAAAACALRALLRSQTRVPEIELAAQSIENQLQRIARIVDDLLDVAGVALGKLSLNCEAVHLASLLSLTIDSCRHRIDAGGHQLALSLADEAIIVRADSQRLLQVFGNLLDNALKFSAPCGKVAIRLERTDRAAVVIVEDDGIGIREDVLPRIFELFVQGGTPMTPECAGLGVGLAIAKQVIEAHGGHIEASSGGIGLGSRFAVVLPLARGTFKTQE